MGRRAHLRHVEDLQHVGVDELGGVDVEHQGRGDRPQQRLVRLGGQPVARLIRHPPRTSVSDLPL